MIVTRNLLSEFLPAIKNYSHEDLIQAFLELGIEVEDYEFINYPSGLFYGIIKSCSEVKGSNKLKLCLVEIPFKKEIFKIVCGAGNVRENLKVLVALPGAKLMNGEIEISVREVFGVLSEGMICAYSELYKSRILNKFEDGNEGIIEFSEDWNIDREFLISDLFLDDLIFDLSIPHNRPDLNSAWGIAHELRKKMNISDDLIFTFHDRKSDLWAIKRLLLTNGQKCFNTYEKNLNVYLFLCFNEVFEDNSSLVVKVKSEFFSILLKSYLDNSKVPECSLKKVFFDLDRVVSFLGSDRDIVEGILKHLFKFDFESGNGYVLIPAWRADLNTERDLCEEIMRFLPFDKILELPINSSTRLVNNEMFLSLEKIKDFWRNRGFFECTTFNLHANRIGEKIIRNPISSNHVSLRNHALYELIEVMHKNYLLKNRLYPIFEIVEIQDLGWTLNLLVPEMDNRFVMNNTVNNYDLYDLQSLLRRMYSLYLNKDLNFAISEISEDPFLKLNFLEINEFDIGMMGYLKTNLPFRSWGAVVYLKMFKKLDYKCLSVSKFPPSFKDISVQFLNTDIKLGNVIDSLKSKYLKRVEIVDKYKIDEHMSYLFRCEFQSPVKTLNRMDIDMELKSVCDILRRFDVKIR